MRLFTLLFGYILLMLGVILALHFDFTIGDSWCSWFVHVLGNATTIRGPTMKIVPRTKVPYLRNTGPIARS